MESLLNNLSLSTFSEHTAVSNIPSNETKSSRDLEEHTVDTLVNRSIFTASQSIGQPPTVENKTDEVEADRLTSNALTSAVHDITHTPLTDHSASLASKNDATTATVTETEQEAGAKIIGNLTAIVRQVPLLSTTDVGKPQEPFQSTDRTETETLSSSSVSLPLQSSQSEDVANTNQRRPSTGLQTVEELSETSINDRQDNHDQTEIREKTRVYERSVSPIKDEAQPDRQTDHSTASLHQSSIEDASRDEEPRLQSSTSAITPVGSIASLTETVRQILSTPVSVHLPSVDHSQTTAGASFQPSTITDTVKDTSPVLANRSFITEITKETSGDDAKGEGETLALPEHHDKPSVRNDEEKTADIIDSTTVTASSMDAQSKSPVVSELSATEHIDTVETSHEQTILQEESERLATQALTEAMQEIIHRPATEPVTSVDRDNQEPANESLVGIMKHVRSIEPRSRALVQEEPTDAVSTASTIDTESTSFDQTSSSEVQTTRDGRLQQEADGQDQLHTEASIPTGQSIGDIAAPRSPREEVEAKPAIVHAPQVIANEVHTLSTESTPETIDQINATSIPEGSALSTESSANSHIVESDEKKKRSTDAPVDLFQPRKIVTTIEETTVTTDGTDKDRTGTSDSSASPIRVTHDEDQILTTPLSRSSPVIDQAPVAEQEGKHQQPSVDSAAVISEDSQRLETSTRQDTSHQSPQEETVQQKAWSESTEYSRDETNAHPIEEATLTSSTEQSASLEPSAPQPEIADAHSTILLQQSSIEEPRLQSSTSAITPIDSVASLTETVRQILSTPVSVHLPSVDQSQTTAGASSQPSTITDTAIDAKGEGTTQASPEHHDKPSVRNDEEKTADFIDSTTVTASSKDTHSKSPVVSELSATEHIDTVETSHEQTILQEESERLATQALTEAMQEIIHRPATEPVTSVDRDNQEPAIESLVGIMNHVLSIEPRSRALVQEEPTDAVSTASTIDTESTSFDKTTTDTQPQQEKEGAKPAIVHAPEVTASEVHTLSTESTPETIDQINATSIPEGSALSTESSANTHIVESDEEKKRSTDAPVDLFQPRKIVTTIEETTVTTDSADKDRTGTSDSSASPIRVTHDEDQILTTPLSRSSPVKDQAPVAEQEGKHQQPSVASTAVISEDSQRLETSTAQVTSHQSPQEETVQQKAWPESTEYSRDETTAHPIEEATLTSSTEQSASLEPSAPQPEIADAHPTNLLHQSSIEDASRDEEPRLQSSTFAITPVDSVASLTETVRQILSTPVSVHLPSVDHSQTTAGASSQPSTITDTANDASPVLANRSFITEISQDSSDSEALAIPTSQGKSSVTDQSNLQAQEGQQTSESTETIKKDTTESNLLQQRDSSDKSESSVAYPSTDFAENAEKIETTVTEARADKQPEVQSDTNLLARKLSVNEEVTSPVDVATPLQSSMTETDQELKTTSETSSENVSLSSSMHERIDNVVSGAIADACGLLDQAVPKTVDRQSLSSTSSVEASLESVSTDTSPVSESVPAVGGEHDSTAGLVNIVHEIRNFPNQISVDTSLPQDDNKNINSPTFDQREQSNVDELTNIVDSITKTLNSQRTTSDLSESTDELPFQRASAVAPTLSIDAPHEESFTDSTPIFFVPGTPTPSETDFQNIYADRYFVRGGIDDEHLTPRFIPSTNEGIVSTEEKDLAPDSPMAYYDLQEERHTLMSPQQSVNDETSATPSLTTWTTTQPLADYDKTEEKHRSTELNLNEQAYQYARQIDMDSSSVISNLPDQEYHQVFGVPEEIVHAVNEMTDQVDRTLSAERKTDEETIVSTEVKRQTSDSEDASPVQQVPSAVLSKGETSVSDSVQRITEALNSLESDLLREEEAASKTALLATAPADHSEQHQNKNETVTDTISDRELDSRYSALLDRIDTLEKSLTDSQSSASSTADDDRHEEQAKVAPGDQTSVEETFSIDGLLETMQQILATPFRTVAGPYEKLASEESNEESGLATALEQILASTQYRTMETKLAGPVDTFEIADRSKVQQGQDEDVESTKEANTSVTEKISETISSAKESVQHFLETIRPPSTEQEETDEQLSSTSDKVATGDVHHTNKETTLAEPEPTTLTGNLTSTLHDDASAITSTLPATGRSDAAPSNVKDLLAKEHDENLVLSQSSRGVEQDEKEQPLEDSSKVIETTTTTTTFHEAKEDTQPVREAPVTSTRLTTAEFVDAQEVPSEAVMEAKASSSLVEKATSIAQRVILSVTSALPVSTPDEKDVEAQEPSVVEVSTPVIQSKITEEVVASPSAVTTPDTSYSEVSDNVVTHDAETSSSTGILDTIRGFLPPMLRTRQADVLDSDERTIETEESKRATLLSSTPTADEPTHKLESSIQLQQGDEPLPNTDSQYFTSRDVYHAYKQPIEPVFEREESPSLADRASSFVTSVISSVTSHLPSSTSTETQSTVKTSSSAFEDEPTVSHPSPGQEEQPSTSGLFEIIQGFVPIGHRPKSIAVADEHQSDESSKAVETKTFHETHGDSEPILETSPTQTTADSDNSPSLLEKATSIVDQIMLSMATALPVSRIEENDTKREDVMLATPSEAEEQKSNIGSEYFTSRDVYHAYKQTIEPVFEREESPSLTDRASSFAANLLSSVTSHLPFTTSAETRATVQPTSTALIEEGTLSQPSAEVKSEQHEHPPTSGLFDIMKSLLPLGHGSKSTAVDESHHSNEALNTTETVTTSTTTIHEVNEEPEPTLKASSIPSTDQFVDAQEVPSDEVLETEESSSLTEKAMSIVEQVISSVSGAPPVSTQGEKDSKIQDETTFEDTTPVLQSTTAEHTGASEAVTVSESIDSDLSDDVKIHTELQPLSSSVHLQQEDEALPTTDSQNFTSGDVHHADKQPIEPVSEREESPSLMDRASSFATNLISSVTSHLPSSTGTETQSTAKTSSSAFEEEPTVSYPLAQHEEHPTTESSKVIETRTFHEAHDDLEPILETSPTQTTVESESQASFLEKATSIVDQIMLSMATGLPVSRIEENDTKHEDVMLATPPTTVRLSESIDSEPLDNVTIHADVAQSQAEKQLPSVGSEYFTSRDVYHAYKQPIEPVFEREESPSLTDRASSFAANLLSSVTSHLPFTTSAETQSAVQPTSTALAAEGTLSQPTAEVKSEQQEHPRTAGLLEIMKSFLPLGHGSKSTALDESHHSNEALNTTETVTTSTTTIHEVMEDSEPTLEASTIPSTDQFVDAQEAPSEAVLETKESSSVSTALPVSTLDGKEAETQGRTAFEDTTPVLQSTTADHTGASEAVTVSESIDSDLSDDVKIHTELQPLSSSVHLQQEDEALPTTDSQNFTSHDVYHAYKQPKPVFEREESPSLTDRASSFAANLLSSVTSHLPFTTSAETDGAANLDCFDRRRNSLTTIGRSEIRATWTSTYFGSIWYHEEPSSSWTWI